MGQAIVTQQTAIQSWGSRDNVREIGNRLAKMSLPGGKRLSEPEIFALAQASIAHGLDPFNGEIWIIPSTGLMIGIKGLRKCARGQIKGNFWTEFRVIDNSPEREQIGIPDGALAYECRLFNTETINAYTTSVKQFSDTKMPWELIIEIVGKRPYTSGYGYYKKGEATKMTPVQCAMKRAEADALKRRFDVPFGMNVDDTADIAPMTAPQWDVIDSGDRVTDYSSSLENGKAQLGRDEGDLTAQPDLVPHFEPIDLPPTAQVETPKTSTNGTTRPYPPERVKHGIDLLIVKHADKPANDKQRGLVSGMLEACFAGDMDSTDKRHSLTAYLIGMDTLKDATPAQVNALLDWVKPTKDEGGHYMPDAMAVKEAQAIIAQRLIDMGQIEMPLTA